MGKIVSIHLAAKAGQAMQETAAATLVAGKGLVGDRYFGRKPAMNVTLVQEEVLVEAAGEIGVSYRPGMSRRNITVRGVALNELIGKRFLIGEAELEGASRCEPCANMERSIGSGAMAALAGRCGIRARVVRGGVVRKDDEIIIIS
ncbi:MAG: MOSC domain-containing protein [candidate division KSB1 bacterium]|nr:MOSC domain-containing protein [candidate division KSB1 bacterium]MDZ7364698.1 MOSC domain-containing protein [candidate division KSB1 bacterium]MDZ7402554.1 MOSC domain-containing protein [candidate division KSB1 bacterium]